MKLLSFVIPAYKSEKTIKFVVDDIKETMRRQTKYDYEIIIVNDSSPDNLLEVLTALAELNSKIRIINLSKNFGQHSALMAGYTYAKGDLIVSLDDDGQTDPREVFKLINKLDEGYDVVFAGYKFKKHSFFRNIGSVINDMMARWLLGKPKDIYLSSYFVARRYVIKEVLKYRYSYTYVSGLLLRTTNRICNVEVEHFERKDGKSTYTFKKLLKLWFNGFTAFSVKPLRISLFFGVVSAFLGIAFGIYTIINKIIAPNVPAGWTSTVTIISFFSGITFIILGLLGEYIGRMYVSLNNNPQYVIRSVICKNENPEEYSVSSSGDLGDKDSCCHENDEE